MNFKIKMLAMDIDGTLTDGKIYVSAEGEAVKAFDIKDGYALAHILPQIGIIPVIITGRESQIVSIRARELNITEVYQGVSDKLETLKSAAEKYSLSPDEIAYIGDDINDIDCIEYCSLSACPADAVPEIKEKAGYICRHNGGAGAVREFISFIEHNG